MEEFRDAAIDLDRLAGASTDPACADAVSRALARLPARKLLTFRPSPAKARAFRAASTGVSVRA